MVEDKLVKAIEARRIAIEAEKIAAAAAAFDRAQEARRTPAREKYLALCASAGLDPIAQENAVLSIGEEFLPECARKVLRGAEPSKAYFKWLVKELEETLTVIDE